MELLKDGLTYRLRNNRANLGLYFGAGEVFLAKSDRFVTFSEQ
jgi:hypothetical protein